MSNPNADRQARIEAIQAARRAHNEGAPIGSGGWVDVFGAILKADVALVFRPLTGMFGAYLPPREGRPAGVLINSNHPLALQRYTAAHELGHHRMGHSPSADGEQEILPRAQAQNRAPTEVAADTFAAFYLMPLRLLDERIKAAGYGASELADSTNVYALSLTFGVSYAAMVRHLEFNKRISPAVAAKLAGETPKSVKQRLMGLVELEDAHADVRDLQAPPKDLVTMRAGDSLILTLPSHASGGYEWQLSGITDESMSLRLQVSHTELGPDRAGASAPERLIVRCAAPGIRNATLAERRPWESPDVPPLSMVKVAVEVLARPVNPYRRTLAGA